MSDRGEYRAIRRVLLDGPDYQKLPERARHVFLVLKLNFGPAGIEVWYPAELNARISAQTGISIGGVQDALMLLEKADWIAREGNIVWIKGQIDNDPHIRPADRKHRAMVQRHVAGLPRLPIVAAYVKSYPAWFVEGGPSVTEKATEDTAREPKRVMEGPSKGLPSTENQDKNETEDENESLVPDGTEKERTVEDILAGSPDDYPPEFEAIWAIYPKRRGNNPKHNAHVKWRARLREGVPLEVLYAGVQRYAAFLEKTDKLETEFVMMGQTFFGPAEHYLESWEAGNGKAEKPLVIRDGWFADAVA